MRELVLLPAVKTKGADFFVICLSLCEVLQQQSTSVLGGFFYLSV